MGEGIANIVIWCLGKIVDVYDNGALETAMTIDVLGGEFSIVYSTIWQWIKGFAMGLIMVYFMWEMNSKWAFEGNDLNMKSLAGPFCKVIFAIILFNNADAIVWGGAGSGQGMLGFYNTLVKKAATEGTVTADPLPSTAALQEQCESLGIMAAVVILLPMLAVVLISYVLKFSFIYKALMIKFEMLFRASFTPLAMADSFNGLNSNSMRWIKGFVGYGVYAAAFLMVPKIGIGIMNTYINNLTVTPVNAAGDPVEGLEFILFILEQIVMIVAIPFAELGVISAVKQLAKEAAG